MDTFPNVDIHSLLKSKKKEMEQQATEQILFGYNVSDLCDQEVSYFFVCCTC